MASGSSMQLLGMCMRSTALQRARHFAFAPKLHRLLILASVAAALLIPMLVLDLGLMIQLLVSRGSQEVPQDWVIGPWVSGTLFAWPFFGERALCMIVLVVSSAVLAGLLVFVRWLIECTAHRYTLHVVTRLRQAVHGQAIRLGTSELLGRPQTRPEMLAVEKADIVCGGLYAWWSTVPYCVVLLLLLVMMSLAVNVWLTLLAILLTGYLLRINHVLRERIEAKIQTWADLAEDRRVAFLALLRLAPLASGYSLDVFPDEAVDSRLAECQEAELRVKNGLAVMFPAMLLVVLWSAGLLLFVVGLSESVTVAGTALLAAALICAYFPATRLYRLPRRLAEAEEAARDIFSYLDDEPTVEQVASGPSLAPLQREIRFDNVTLASEADAALLNGVSFEIPARKKVAIVASDRETPLALAGLLVRFYDPTNGRILFDSQDIRNVTLDAVREQAILVWRDSWLFAGSIATNISCGDTGLSLDQIKEAAGRARAAQFIQELPASFETRVGLDGVSLPEDQAFRIALARGLLRKPSLLLIQEPNVTDEESGLEVTAALNHAAETATLLIIPSRLATLRGADVIYVFHEGKLAARGRHVDLLNDDELYRHIIYVRFNAFRDQVSD
jgi:ABC-type multidrug transport system fused ATPase/permease subunit